MVALCFRESPLSVCWWTQTVQGLESYQLFIYEITSISHVNLFSDRPSYTSQSAVGRRRIYQTWQTKLLCMWRGNCRVPVCCVCPSTLYRCLCAGDSFLALTLNISHDRKTNIFSFCHQSRFLHTSRIPSKRKTSVHVPIFEVFAAVLITLKRETLRSSETSITIHQSTQSDIFISSSPVLPPVRCSVNPSLLLQYIISFFIDLCPKFLLPMSSNRSLLLPSSHFLDVFTFPSPKPQ